MSQKVRYEIQCTDKRGNTATIIYMDNQERACNTARVSVESNSRLVSCRVVDGYTGRVCCEVGQ